MQPVYLPRLVDPLISELLAEFPAVLMVGPRATGKTTTARRHARTIVQLDEPGRAAAFHGDPDAALRGLEEPVLVDEWQLAPPVLGAIKRTVDIDPRPGRFVITGSVRAVLDAESWPLTGRAIRVPMAGLVERELQGAPTDRAFVDVLATADINRLRLPRERPDLRDYVSLALRSGFPEAVLRETERARRLWLESYVHQLLTRDIDELEPGRDPDKLRRYLEVLALNTAGVADHAVLYDAAGISRMTAMAYDRLLGNLLITETLPAWTSSRLKRLVRMPKRLLMDPGLVGAILGLDVEAVIADGGLLGRVIETFVVAQLRAELPLSENRPRLYHLRTEKGRHEVDLMIEYGGGRVVGVEVKATAAPTAESSRHLRWLRDELGDRFICGIVLHTGPGVFSLADRIAAVPICAVWG